MSNRAHIEPAVPFRFGGHDALDFVNTVNTWVRPFERDYIETFGKLIAWSWQVGLIDASKVPSLSETPPRIAAAAHREALTLRGSLLQIFGAVIDGGVPRRADMLALNALLAEARSKQVLTPGAGEFGWVWAGDVDARTPTLLIALAAAELLERIDLTRLKRCPGPDGCGWLFVDVSRNRSRRWCSMDYCGSSAKARRFANQHRRSR
jgi:predicted RNA-binding Zn ribbon-like protein